MDMKPNLPARVIVEIDRLVLRGFPRATGAELARHIQHELGERLAEPAAAALFSSSRAIGSVRVADPVRITPDSAGGLGSQVAASIVRGLKE